MRNEAKSIVMHTIAGIVMGGTTSMIDTVGGNVLVIIGLTVLLLLRKVTLVVFKPEEKNFWMANGFMQYLFTWLAVAIIVLNA